MNDSWSSRYEAAVTMYNREHDRWYQWALFFFGAVGAIFYVTDRFHAHCTFAPALSCLMSLVWVAVASNIRATTDSWRETLHALELNPDNPAGPFEIFKAKLDAYDFRLDFVKTLQVWRHRTFTSVTRWLVLMGLFSCLGFAAATLVYALGIQQCPVECQWQSPT